MGKYTCVYPHTLSAYTHPHTASNTYPLRLSSFHSPLLRQARRCLPHLALAYNLVSHAPQPLVGHSLYRPLQRLSEVYERPSGCLLPLLRWCSMCEHLSQAFPWLAALGHTFALLLSLDQDTLRAAPTAFMAGSLARRPLFLWLLASSQSQRAFELLQSHRIHMQRDHRRETEQKYRGRS